MMEAILFFTFFKKGEASTMLSRWHSIRGVDCATTCPTSVSIRVAHMPIAMLSLKFSKMLFFTLQRSPNLGTCPHVGSPSRSEQYSSLLNFTM
jgi:hypothetical protein